MKNRVAAVAATALLAAGLLAPQASSETTLPLLSLSQVLEIANIEAPPAGVGVKIHADFPGENPLEVAGQKIYSLTADISPTGVMTIEHAATAGEEDSASIQVADECNDHAFAPSTARWRAEDMPVEWRFNSKSIPSTVNRFLAKRAMRLAHQVWPRAKSECGEAKIGVRYSYAGVTGKSIRYDGVNAIEFGELGSESLAVNYTWYKADRILEVDMRLNRTDYPWTAKKQGPNRYNVINVVTHELGHQVGLEDLGEPHRSLTMFAKIMRGEIEKASLGRGDLKGGEFVSP